MLIVVIGAAGYYLYTTVGRTGSSELENWVGRCVVGIIESHLTARVEFDQLDYEAPGSVTLSGLRLLAEDATPLIRVASLKLTLAEVPRLNQPIQIAKVTLDSPSLYFAQGESGSLIGWDSLVKPEVLDEGLDAAPENYRLSEVLVMRRIEINDGQIEYRSNTDEQPMVLRGVTTALDTSPDVDDPGWYAIKGNMSRAPQLDIQFDGRFNIDSILLELAGLTAKMELQEAQYETLPPQIQTFVRQYALRGALSATLNGTISATNPLGSSADLNMTLRDAFASFGESVLPIDEVRLTAKMADRSVNLDAQADLLSGSAGAQATVSLDDTMPVSAAYEASKINLKQTLATTSPDQPPSYDGILKASGKVRTNALTPLESIKGSGTLNIEKGRLVNLPVISDLAKAASAPFGGKKDVGTDEALVEYRFMPDHLAIGKIELASPVIAARGDGKVYYDQRLSLALNAGPMEKLQNNLGKIGDLFGKITDSLVKYYVSGTLSKPNVSVKPLGIGAGG